jgi:hypothetical protein
MQQSDPADALPPILQMMIGHRFRPSSCEVRASGADERYCKEKLDQPLLADYSERTVAAKGLQDIAAARGISSNVRPR